MINGIKILLALVCLELASLPVFAEDAGAMMPMDGRIITESHHGRGKINSVNLKTGEINISHGPISSLHWAAMTKDFVVQDKAVLNKLKPGQKAEFELIEVSKGKYVVSEIRVYK